MMAQYDCCNIDESTLLRSTKYALQDAAEKGDVQAIEALLKPPAEMYADIPLSIALPIADINGRDNTGCTVLHTAVLFKQLDVVKLCIARGAKLSLKCNGSPLVHIILAMASLSANHEFATAALAELLAAGMDVASSDDLGRLPLHVCALHGLTDSAAALWAHQPAREKLDLNGQDRTGATALHTAADAKQQSMVQWLLSAGASADIADKSGDYAAHTAAKAGWVEGAKLLQSRMADGSAVNGAGLTVEEVLAPLHPSSGSCNTVILTHADCLHHHTCGPITRDTSYFPPENTLRLDVLLNDTYGTLRAKELVGSEAASAGSSSSARVRIVDRAPPAKLSDVLRVHEYEYVRRVLHASGNAGVPAVDRTVPSSDLGGMDIDMCGPAGTSSSSATPGPAHDPKGVHLMDADTAVSRGSWPAALKAAGAVCAAIDAVMSGSTRTAFCAIRPPGHHAGPRGIVTSDRDPEGSHGFCLLNNVAIGAAYAVATYGRRIGGYAAEAGLEGPHSAAGVPQAPVPVRRIAVFDFDVHHGNGTEAILRSLAPHEVMTTVTLPFARAAIGMMSYKPWLDEADGSRVMFVSTHGYGTRYDGDGRPVPVSVFYPGSGRSTGWDVRAVDRLTADVNGSVTAAGWSGAGAGASAALSEPITPFPSKNDETMLGTSSATGAASLIKSGRPGEATAMSSLASPRTAWASAHEGGEAVTSEANPLPAAVPSLQPMPVPEPMYERGVSQPHIINVAMPHSGGPKAWRRAMVTDVLPRLAAFQPDLILVSAGFDAHKADSINSGYIRLTEDDYAWITRQLVKIANTTAHGRVVSVLEGGYKVQGRIVSPFARSVAAHVRALSTGIAEQWDSHKEREQLKREMIYEAEQAAKAAAAADAAAAARAAALSASAGPASSPVPGFKSPRQQKGGVAGAAGSVPASAMPAAASLTAQLLAGGAGSAAASGPARRVPEGSPPAPMMSIHAPQDGGADSTPAVAAGSTSAGPAASPDASGGDGRDTGRSKRRRVAVDYAALDAQLKAEQAGATGAAGTPAQPQ